MTNKHWRELVEIVGVVGIVAAMILVASELRESNRIAAAQAALQINEQISLSNMARVSDPNVAKLYPKLESPEAHLTTATDASQIRGLAWDGINILRSVHSAFANKLISRKERDAYIADFAYELERWPGIRSHYVEIYENLESIQGQKEYAPILDYIAENEAVDTP